MTRFLILPTALFMGLSFVTTAWAGCEKDTDCKGDRICEANECVDPTQTPASTAAPEADKSTDGSEAKESTDTDAEPTEQTPADDAKGPSESSDEKSDTDKKAPTDPKNWWKQSARTAEAPVLQEIFNSMPRPVVKKGNAKLLYHRSVPVVVADIHDSTSMWGGKEQVNVRFIGISKVHSTTTMEAISETTPGVAYCPVNCDRITSIQTADNNIIFVYDGDIKEWAGKVSDVHAGYTRKIGKHNRAACSFPVLENHAPGKAWLDPQEVQAVQTAAVDEIKRYCGR